MICISWPLWPVGQSLSSDHMELALKATVINNHYYLLRLHRPFLMFNSEQEPKSDTFVVNNETESKFDFSLFKIVLWRIDKIAAGPK